MIDSLGGGGAERQFFYLLKNLNKEKFDCKVFLTKRSGVWEEELNKYNIEIFENYIEVNKWKIKEEKGLKLLRKLIEEFKPDVVNSWLFRSNKIVGYLEKKIKEKGAKIIFCQRTHYNQIRVGKSGLKFIKHWYRIEKLLNKANLIIVNSFSVRNENLRLYRINKDKMKVIHNSLDFANLKREKYLKEAKFIREKFIKNSEYLIISCGRLERQKGYEYLLQSVKDVLDKNYKVKLVIIGEGGGYQNLKNMIKALNLENNVFFLNYQKNIFPYYIASDLFASTSLWEGMPNVILESMALKLPVIAFNIPAMREVLDKGKCGLLVPIKNIKMFAQGMIKLLTDIEFRNSLVWNAFEKIKNFTIPSMVSKFENEFLRIYYGK